MILHQNSVTNYYTEFSNGMVLNGVHVPSSCSGRGCAIHNHPSDHDLMNADMDWDEDNILRRICKHGDYHPDKDSATYLTSIGQDYYNNHVCDGCCNVQ
jgi:hypothetical protein